MMSVIDRCRHWSHDITHLTNTVRKQTTSLNNSYDVTHIFIVRYLDIGHIILHVSWMLFLLVNLDTSSYDGYL